MDRGGSITSTSSTEDALAPSVSDDVTTAEAGQPDDVTERRCEKYNLRRSSVRVRVQAERRGQERLLQHHHQQQHQPQQVQEKGVDDDDEEEDDDDDVMDRRGSRKAARRGRGGSSREDGKQRKPKSRPPPLSKYRRRSANARERCRMAEINDAFEDLKAVLPQHGLEAAASAGGSEGSGSEDGQQQSVGSSTAASSSGRNGRGKSAAKGGGSGGRGGSKHQPTKITVLRLAINYIAALREMLGYNADGSAMIGDLPDAAGTGVSDSLVSGLSNAGIQQGLLPLSSFCGSLTEAPGDATVTGADDHTQDFYMVDERTVRVSPGATTEKGGSREVAFAAECDRLTGPGMVPKIEKTKRTRRRTSVRGGRRSRATASRSKAQTSQTASGLAGGATTVNGPEEESVLCSHVSEVSGGSIGVLCKTRDSLVTAAADRPQCVEDDLLSGLLLLRGTSDNLDFRVPCKDRTLVASTAPGVYPALRGDLHLPIDVLLPFRTEDLGSDAASTSTTATTTPTASCSSGDEESLLSSPTSDMEAVVTELDFFTAGFCAADFSPDLSPDFTATLSPEDDMCLELVASVF